MGTACNPATASAPPEIAGLVSEPEAPNDQSAYRQAIEDVLPLMRSLHARGDSVRLAQLARSVIEVWTELESVQPEAVLDDELREMVESWAGRDRGAALRDEPERRTAR